jgi:hypothetical protein
MKERVAQRERVSRTIDSNPRASRQAAIGEVLQMYSAKSKGDSMRNQKAEIVGNGVYTVIQMGGGRGEKKEPIPLVDTGKMEKYSEGNIGEFQVSRAFKYSHGNIYEPRIDSYESGKFPLTVHRESKTYHFRAKLHYYTSKEYRHPTFEKTAIVYGYKRPALKITHWDSGPQGV